MKNKRTSERIARNFFFVDEDETTVPTEFFFLDKSIRHRHKSE